MKFVQLQCPFFGPDEILSSSDISIPHEERSGIVFDLIQYYQLCHYE